MTDKPTPTKEQIQRACDLANATAYEPSAWELGDYSQIGVFTTLADTIAQLDAMQAERDRNQASRQYHKAKRQEAEADRDKARAERAAANIRASELKLGFDKATADLGEIADITKACGWHHSGGSCGKVAAIAAPYRVEPDPLVAALDASWFDTFAKEDVADLAKNLRAELAKRGLGIGEKNA